MSAESTPAHRGRPGKVGAWADRTDIGESVEYARQLRRQAERREWD